MFPKSLIHQFPFAINVLDFLPFYLIFKSFQAQFSQSIERLFPLLSTSAHLPYSINTSSHLSRFSISPSSGRALSIRSITFSKTALEERGKGELMSIWYFTAGIGSVNNSTIGKSTIMKLSH